MCKRGLVSGRRTEMYLNSSCMDRDVVGRPEAQSNVRSGVLPGLRQRPPNIDTVTSASAAVRAVLRSIPPARERRGHSLRVMS